MPLTQSFTQCFVAPCFRAPGQSWDELCAAAHRIGYRAIERWQRDTDWDDFCAAAKRHGLRIASFVGHASLPRGVANVSEHARILAELRVSLSEAQSHDVPNLIVLAGNREDGVADATHRAHAVTCLRAIAPAAETAGVTLNLEVLNTKIDHPGYVCDRLEWALDVVQQVNSPRVRILLDLYHRQIMEGDVIRALTEAAGWIGHIHTAGNPGRHELDATQEIHWPAVATAIAASGFNGFVSHELFPRGDRLAALAQAFAACSVCIDSSN